MIEFIISTIILLLFVFIIAILTSNILSKTNSIGKVLDDGVQMIGGDKVRYYITILVIIFLITIVITVGVLEYNHVFTNWFENTQRQKAEMIFR